MAEFSLPSVQDMSKEDLVELVAKMNKTLSWLLRNLDSLNVTSINTNLTTVSSENGETVIAGPVLQMYDSNRLRLQMGYDNGDFVFEMFNKAGEVMLDLDSNGNALFQGILRTGATGRRIEISSNTLFAYDTTGVARFELRPTADYYELWLRGQTGLHEGTISATDNQFNITATHNLAIGAGTSGTGKVYFTSDVDFQMFNVDFSDATVQGLATMFQEHHNHGIPPGTKLLVEGGGTVTWVESGAHAHNVVSFADL